MLATFTERQVGDVTIIDCAGRITLGDETIALRNAINEALAAGKRKIVLSMKDVKYIDSACVGEMVSGFTTVKLAGGLLMLLSLSPRSKRELECRKLDTVFKIHESEADAIRSFN